MTDTIDRDRMRALVLRARTTAAGIAGPASFVNERDLPLVALLFDLAGALERATIPPGERIFALLPVPTAGDAVAFDGLTWNDLRARAAAPSARSPNGQE